MNRPATPRPADPAARDPNWSGAAPRRRSSAGEPPQGYFQSSQELRAGLEISWQPLTSLPADLAAAFTAVMKPGPRSSPFGV